MGQHVTSLQQQKQQSKKWILIMVDRLCDKIGRQNFAFLLMIFSQIIYPLGFLFSNQNKLNVVQTNLMRGLTVIILSVIVARYFSLDLTYKSPQNFRILMLRNLLTCFQAFCFTIIQFYLAQPIVQTLNSTGPLFVFLLDYFINGVLITKKQFLGVFLGITGVLLTVNGQLILKLLDKGYENNSQFQNYQTSSPLVKIIVALVFLASTFLWAYAQIITKRMVGANSIQISIHLAFYLVFVSGLLYPILVTQPADPYVFVQGIFAGGLLLAGGQVTYFGAILLTKNTGNITMMIFVSVVVGYLVSILRYNETVNPICLVGTALIVFGLARIVLKDKIQIENHSKPINLTEQIKK